MYLVAAKLMITRCIQCKTLKSDGLLLSCHVRISSWAKQLSVRLQTKWLWIQFLLRSLKFSKLL